MQRKLDSADDSAWADIGTTAVDHTTFTDTLPGNDPSQWVQKYDYRVIALGPNPGDDASNSDPSNVATASGIGLQSVAFSGSGDETIYRDDGGGAYQGAQWYDTNMNGTIDSSAPKYSNGTIDDQLLGPPPAGTVYEHDYPVAYARSTSTSPDYVTATPSFVCNGAVGPGWEIEGSGGAGYLTFPATPVGGAGFSVTSTQPLPTTITSTTMMIDWKLSTDGGKTWLDMGASTNHLYVTGAPIRSDFETVLDLGCRSANGLRPSEVGELNPGAEGADVQILDTIFDSVFKSLTVNDVAGNLLTYWGSEYGLGCTWPALRNGTTSLLRYHDGRCGEWASSFLPDVMSAQGVYITSEPDLTVSFTHAVPAQPAGSGPGFFTPAKAQGDKVPTEQWFGDHVVDEFNAGDLGWILLDPSYGKRVSGASQQAAETEWATQAIAAGVQGDWVVPGDPVTGPPNSGPTGNLAGSDPFAIVPGDFVFPH